MKSLRERLTEGRSKSVTFHDHGLTVHLSTFPLGLEGRGERYTKYVTDIEKYEGNERPDGKGTAGVKGGTSKDVPRSRVISWTATRWRMTTLHGVEGRLRQRPNERVGINRTVGKTVEGSIEAHNLREVT